MGQDNEGIDRMTKISAEAQNKHLDNVINETVRNSIIEGSKDGWKLAAVILIDDNGKTCTASRMPDDILAEALRRITSDLENQTDLTNAGYLDPETGKHYDTLPEGFENG